MSIKNYIITKKANLARRVHTIAYKKNLEKTINFDLEESSDLTISVLCSNTTVEMAIGALKSLYRFLDISYPLNLHDDGSLTAVNKKEIQDAFRGVNIISREKSDKELEQFFDRHNLRDIKEFRKKNNVNLKLTDFTFFCKSSYCLQIDSDILFFKKPYFLEQEFLRDLIASRAQSSFYNIDRGPANCYYENDMERITGKSMPYQFNGGVVLFPVNLDLIKYADHILSLALKKHKVWTEEQTIFSMYLNSTGICSGLENNFDVSFRLLEKSLNYNYNLLSTQHYCAWARNLFYYDFNKKIYPFLKKEDTFQQYFYQKIKGKPKAK